MIDAYDVLGLGVTADAAEIKKAFRKLSLQYHPDKMAAQGAEVDARGAAVKFQEIKAAHDVLQDEERRKIYDTFGVDLGEERPEMEMWNIGMNSLLSPLGIFAFKTVAARLVLWVIGLWLVRWGLIFIGAALGGMYALDLTIKGFAFRHPDNVQLLLCAAALVALVLVHWAWYRLSDGAVIFFLVFDVVGPVLFQGWQVSLASALGSLFLGWLIDGWWFWVIGFEVFLMVVVLVALMIASGMMRLWIDSMQVQKADSVKEARLALRKERKRMQDEIASLQSKLNGAKATSQAKTGRP